MLAVVFALVRALGAIGRQVSELQETMMWADWPTSPKRASVNEPAELQTASTA